MPLFTKKENLHLLSYIGLLRNLGCGSLGGSGLRRFGSSSLLGCGLLFAYDLGILDGVGLLDRRAARTTRLALCGILRSGLAESIGIVEIDELDDAHVGTVTETETRFQDTGITARTLGDLGSDRTEQLRNGLLLLQVREYYTARMSGVLLRSCRQRLDELLNGLGLGDGRRDALVQDERRGHIRKHCLAVAGLSAKMIKIFIVSHN